MGILLKAIYRFNVFSINISMAFFTESGKSILKFIWKHKRPCRAKAILCRKNNDGDITIQIFKLYYRVTVMKSAWHQHNITYTPVEQNSTNTSTKLTVSDF
jgi:hypothetical protein